MSLDALLRLQTQLQERQVQADLNSRVALAVTNSGHWPVGNSFWVTHADGEWFVGTYGPAVYAVPESVSVPDLCCDFLSQETTRAWSRVLEAMLAKHGLRELTDEEYGDLEERRWALAKRYPPMLSLAGLANSLQLLNENYKHGFSIHCAGERFLRVEQDGARVLWFTIYDNAWHVRVPSGRIYECLTEGDDLDGLCVYWLKEDPLPDGFDEGYLDGYSLLEVEHEHRSAIDRHATDWTQ